MSVHHVCTLSVAGFCAASLRILQGTIGRHYSWGIRPLQSQARPSIAPEGWHVGGIFAGLRLAFDFSMYSGWTSGESRFAFRRGQTIQFFAMVVNITIGLVVSML